MRSRRVIGARLCAIIFAPLYNTTSAPRSGLILVCSDVNHAARGDRFDEVGELIGNDRCGAVKKLALSSGGILLKFGSVEGEPIFLIWGRTHELARVEAQ